MSERYLICTDLDRTLIPNGPQPEPPGARKRFAALTARSEVTLAYVSGRHRALIEEAIVSYRLPIPDFVIGDVGTTIYRIGAEPLPPAGPRLVPRDAWKLSWTSLDLWEAEIARDWAGHTHEELRGTLRGIPALRLQERSKQNRHKLSFYLPLYVEVDKLSAAVRQRLDPLGIRYRLVWSVDDVADIGLLDILPERASKLHAIEYLMQTAKLDATHTVFCGDSGNDLEVLASRVPSVLVANSRPDVQDLALELSEEAGTLQQLYIATGGYLGMNGNYAGGILEGIVHFHPRMADWLQEAPAGSAGSAGSDGAAA
jgi:HAD superfamily hydrolase (TIGR01484 family)